MRRTEKEVSSDYKIALVDDEQGIIDSLSIIIKRMGYVSKGFTNPLEAIERIREEHFDILILDYLMEPIHGDDVIRRIREFNQDIYILLLTGHRDIAPPLETIKSLDIQGYCEKSDKFDQMILLIESGIKAVSQMKTIKRYKNDLNKMVLHMPEIYQLRPVERIMEDVVSGIMLFENCPDIFMLVDDATGNLEAARKGSIYKGSGRFKAEPEKLMTMLDLDLMAEIGEARTSQKPVFTGHGAFFPLLNELRQSIGVLYVDRITSDHTVKLIEIYAKQAAAAISNAFLHNLVNIKNEELNGTYEDLKNMYIDTVQALRLAVDAKDVYTRGHSDRVAVYAAKIGEAFKLGQDDLELLRLGGIFHDIGKIGTADDILFKTEGLNAVEYDEVKKHTVKGAHILSAVSMFSSVVPIIKCHHERIDGKGYPDGLMGNEIPFLARVLSVADAFDAMTTDRLYRPRLGLEEAVRQLVTAAGTQFDVDVVNKFVDLLRNYEELEQQLHQLTIHE